MTKRKVWVGRFDAEDKKELIEKIDAFFSLYSSDTKTNWIGRKTKKIKITIEVEEK